MRKKDELSDPASCMSRAKDDEWTFVLLGRDAAATVAVEAWIKERVRIGKNKPDDAQIIEAMDWIASVLAERGEACTVAVAHNGSAREWYAGMAMSSLCLGLAADVAKPDGAPLIAAKAFAIADAMLAEANKSKTPE